MSTEKEFKWDDNNVKEFVEQYFHHVDVPFQGYYFKNMAEDFKKSKLQSQAKPQPSSIDRIEVKSIPNKQDEIRIAELEKELDVTESLLNERQRILDAIPECEAHGKCVPHALDWVEMKKSKIYSQSEVDTIRKETWDEGRKLTSGLVIGGYMGIGLKYPTLQDYLNSLSKETKPKEEDKPVLFITEDGVEIRNGDHAFYVQDDNNWMVVSHSGITEKRPYPYFHTSESANKWVLENKPCLSLNEVKELANNNGAKVLCIPDEKISNYTKQKLNQQ